MREIAREPCAVCGQPRWGNNPAPKQRTPLCVVCYAGQALQRGERILAMLAEGQRQKAIAIAIGVCKGTVALWAGRRNAGTAERHLEAMRARLRCAERDAEQRLAERVERRRRWWKTHAPRYGAGAQEQVGI